MSEYHTPVLLDESVSALIDNPSGLYIDATFGGGGHTAEILSRLTGKGKVLAFDRDIDAIGNRLKDERLILVHNNWTWACRPTSSTRRTADSPSASTPRSTCG